MTDKQYYARARRVLGIKAAEVLAWGVRDGEMRITMHAGQQHIIPLADLEPRERKNASTSNQTV